MQSPLPQRRSLVPANFGWKAFRTGQPGLLADPLACRPLTEQAEGRSFDGELRLFRLYGEGLRVVSRLDSELALEALRRPP